MTIKSAACLFRTHHILATFHKAALYEAASYEAALHEANRHASRQPRGPTPKGSIGFNRRIDRSSDDSQLQARFRVCLPCFTTSLWLASVSRPTPIRHEFLTYSTKRYASMPSSGLLGAVHWPALSTRQSPRRTKDSISGADVSAFTFFCM